MRRFVLVPLLAFALLGFTGCGDDDDDGTDDNGTPDASTPGTPDAAPGGDCPLTFASCTTYEDKTGENAVTVEISAGTPFVYMPKCLKVKAGTAVTIKANATHPLKKGNCGDDFIGGTKTTDTTVTMSEGVYSYFCTAHGSATGSGQAGAIQVVP